MALELSVPWSTQTSISGGSRLTDVNEFTVNPQGFPEASRVVTIVIPVAKCPITLRNVSLVTGMIPLLFKKTRLGNHALEYPRSPEMQNVLPP
jgi:hypothetical protein